MRADLLTSPKVVRISSALNADRLRVIGGLMAVWCLFDAHSEDGTLHGYTAEIVDQFIGFPGFAVAMAAVEWLAISPDFVSVPRFYEHNGQSAKRRAQEAQRKRVERGLASALNADKLRTREEKRRVIQQPLIAPLTALQAEKPKRARRAKSAELTFDAWTAECKASQTPVIPDDDKIHAYAESAGITTEMLRLCWQAFRDRYSGTDKKYADWRAAFRNGVRENWFRIWYVADNGDVVLTTAGRVQEKVANATG